ASAEWPTFFTASDSRSLDTSNLSAQYWTSCGSSRLMRLRSCGPLFLRSSGMGGLRRCEYNAGDRCEFQERPGAGIAKRIGGRRDELKVAATSQTWLVPERQ